MVQFEDDEKDEMKNPKILKKSGTMMINTVKSNLGN